MFDDPIPHPPRRYEGFHIPASHSQKSLANNHISSPSPVLSSASPQMLHHSPFGHMASFSSQAPPGSSLFTDAELLESLMGSPSQFSIPPFSPDPAPPSAFQPPLRSLPRHLDSASPAPSSPNNDLYSPGSGSSVGAPPDLTAEHHYGSFAPDPDPLQQRPGRPSGRAPAPRSRSARRPSASIRTSILSRAIPSSEHQASERPLAISVPTYLSTRDWQPSEGAKVSFQLDCSNRFVGSCSPADSILSSAIPHQTPTNMGASLPMSEEVSSMVGSPIFGTRSVDGVGQDQEPHAVLNEKRRRRRESHNAVERRRRENINERIQDLCKLLPAVLLTESSAPGAVEEEEGVGVVDAANGNNNNKHNKGFILAKSVDYIKHLKELVDLQAQENSQLKQALSSARQQLEPSLMNSSFTHQHQEQQQQIDEASFFQHHLGLWATQDRVGVGVSDASLMPIEH